MSIAPWSRPSATLLPVLVAAGAGLWLVDLTRSFWLDETVTAWVVAEGLPEAVRRGFEYQFSCLAFVFPWLSVQLLGHGEVALRLPSLVAMGVATWSVARLTRELWDVDAGWLAALSFATVPLIVLQAGNAKPYAFSVALVALSMWRFIVWLKDGRTASAVQAAVLAALVPYVQPVVGIVLVVPALLTAIAVLREPHRRRAAALAWGSALVLMAPLWFVARRLLEAGPSLSYAAPATSAAVVELMAPPLVVSAGLAALLGARLVAPGPLAPAAPPRWTLELLLGWLLVPCLLSLAVSRLTPVNIFVPHYLVGITPALPALVGGVLGSLVAPRGRLVAAAVVVLTAVAAQGGVVRTHEDWRGAAVALRGSVASSTPVLVVSGLVEGADVRWLRDPERAAYLTAPFRTYPVPGRLVPFPWTVNAGTRAYLDEVIAGLRGEPRFVLVTRGDGSDIARFLSERLGPATFSLRRAVVEGVYVAIFDRTEPAPAGA